MLNASTFRIRVGIVVLSFYKTTKAERKHIKNSRGNMVIKSHKLKAERKHIQVGILVQAKTPERKHIQIQVGIMVP